MATSFGEIIEAEIKKLKDLEFNYQKLAIIFNVIELRHKTAEISYQHDLFLDVKKMITYYVGAIDESYYGYYEAGEENLEKVLEKVSYTTMHEQINLILFLQRRLRLAGFDDESDSLDGKVDSLRMKVFSQKLNLKNIIRIIGLLSTKTILNLLISISVVFVIYSTILLPAPAKWMSIFNVDYEIYSPNFTFNHFLNTLLSFCQIESDFSIMPTNFIGVLCLILIKGSLLVLLFNYFITEFKKRFKI